MSVPFRAENVAQEKVFWPPCEILCLCDERFFGYLITIEDDHSSASHVDTKNFAIFRRHVGEIFIRHLLSNREQVSKHGQRKRTRGRLRFCQIVAAT